jgi:hypothetical protein
MKLIMRVGLGLVVAGYGLLLLIPMLNATAYQLGVMHRIKPAAARMVPLWAATPPWQLCVWALSVVLMLAAGVQLMRGRRAFRIFVTGFVVTAALWWVYRELPQYRQAFTAQETRSDYYILAVMLLVGAGVWLVERPPSRLPAAT